MTKTKRDTSDQPIELTIESVDVPNLTLIDLPGIARLSNQNEDGEDIYQQVITADMFEMYGW